MGLLYMHYIQTYKNNHKLVAAFLKNLEQSYQEWPEHQQAKARKALNDIIDNPQITLQDLQIVHTKGYSPSAQNCQPTSIARRDPFGLSWSIVK
ncbi:15581_t:CDS:2 [Gigaspora margarita]|uniref:15581_t:CDS:1 n=1 Tax=Gigaspora margarita TaxID=4874 RepID=A0ABN7V6V9_GIGMA|nr:15581_t:CDS:2 [Gigaspora margarita]